MVITLDNRTCRSSWGDRRRAGLVLLPSRERNTTAGEADATDDVPPPTTTTPSSPPATAATAEGFCRLRKGVASATRSSSVSLSSELLLSCELSLSLGGAVAEPAGSAAAAVALPLPVACMAAACMAACLAACLAATSSAPIITTTPFTGFVLLLLAATAAAAWRNFLQAALGDVGLVAAVTAESPEGDAAVMPTATTDAPAATLASYSCVLSYSSSSRMCRGLGGGLGSWPWL